MGFFSVKLILLSGCWPLAQNLAIKLISCLVPWNSAVGRHPLRYYSTAFRKFLKFLRDVTIVSLLKNYVSKADCGNCRALPSYQLRERFWLRLSSITWSPKSLKKTCQKPSVESVQVAAQLTWSQSVQQVHEKCTEQKMDLYTVFTDLTKAFDTVNTKEAIWGSCQS